VDSNRIQVQKVTHCDISVANNLGGNDVTKLYVESLQATKQHGKNNWVHPILHSPHDLKKQKQKEKQKQTNKQTKLPKRAKCLNLATVHSTR
jgi:hypothetical protein